ncbi:MAG: hypothetical protein JWR19_1211 [Pedosphaera sp.]|nr:hypothetical protein [Pedosphaera sp.]
MINPVIHHQPTPDAAAQRDIENGICIHARAVAGLTQRGHIRIIVYEHRRTGQALEPVAQIKPGPTFNVM